MWRKHKLSQQNKYQNFTGLSFIRAQTGRIKIALELPGNKSKIQCPLILFWVLQYLDKIKIYNILNICTINCVAIYFATSITWRIFHMLSLEECNYIFLSGSPLSPWVQPLWIKCSQLLSFKITLDDHWNKN